MLVDSKGSMKPLDSPMATTLAVPRKTAPSCRESTSRPRLTKRFRSSRLAEEQRFCLFASRGVRSNRRGPFPIRCCSGMRHCHPAVLAVERVQWIGRTGVARSAPQPRGRKGASGFQSSYPVPSFSLDQQAAKAGAIDEQISGHGEPTVASVHSGDIFRIRVHPATSTTLPSMRRTPLASAGRAGSAHRGRHRNDRRRLSCASGIGVCGPGRVNRPSSAATPLIDHSRMVRKRVALRVAQIELVEGNAAGHSARAVRTGGSNARRVAPQSTNSIPTLKLPWLAARNSSSPIPTIVIESHQRRDRRLTHSDGADLVGFRRAQSSHCGYRAGSRPGSRRHPPGGAAANDHDLADGVVSHDCHLERGRRRGGRRVGMSNRVRASPARAAVAPAQAARRPAGPPAAALPSERTPAPRHAGARS